jgi:hypothetical protein
MRIECEVAEHGRVHRANKQRVKREMHRCEQKEASDKCGGTARPTKDGAAVSEG